MTHEGTFERRGSEAAPLEGAGSIDVAQGGARIRASAQRTVLITVLSVLAALATSAAAVTGGFLLLDLAPAELHLFEGTRALRAVAGVGGAALLGAYVLARRLLPSVVPKTVLDVVVPFRYLVSAAAQAGELHVGCTAPSCEGRITFRTAHPERLLAEIQRAAAS